MKNYDYIIAGMGAAGLSLAFYLSQSSLRDKKVLLVDNALKNQNDRTWCFWQNTESPFESIVCKSWKNIRFFHPDFEKKIGLEPYAYKMIRGEDFYRFTQECIRKNTSFEWLQADIQGFDTSSKSLLLHTTSESYQASYIFDSLWDMHQKPEQKKGYHYLYQHFKGYIIESPFPCFEPDAMYYMDFRVPQKEKEVRFGYVLPFHSNKALVEFTIFSENLLAPEEYTQELKDYISSILHIENYLILEEEFGIIPMFDAPFPVSKHPKIIPIGTKSGCAKASTGFAFDRIQRQSQRIVECLLAGRKPKSNVFSGRHHLYDSALLNVISKNRMASQDIFGRMFQNHPIDRIFRFLDEKSSLLDDLQIMASMPWMPFLKAIAQNILRK